MSDAHVHLSVEVTDLAKTRAALIQGGDSQFTRPRASWFGTLDEYPTEGEFRAAIADAVAQLLDELL